eukprot:1161013-Pelagomonas_calceolata.AAC.1
MASLLFTWLVGLTVSVSTIYWGHPKDGKHALRGGDRPRWRVPHDVPAAYGGLINGQVLSSWDASLRQ